jgi:hypothetical protein
MLNGASCLPGGITFDDGYRDVYQNALPVMQRYGYVGTLYIIVDQIGVGGYLNTTDPHSSGRVGAWQLTNARKFCKSGVSMEKNSPAPERRSFLPSAQFLIPYGSSQAAILSL